MTHIIDKTADNADGVAARWRRALRRLSPLLLLAGLIGAFFYFDGSQYLMIQTLADNRHVLMAFVQENTIGSVLLFMLLYTVVTAMAVPGSAVLSIAGGFLFGIALGAAWIVIAATAGATILFLLARSAFGDALRRKAGPALKNMEAGFKKNAFSYLLSLRLVPVFPFFLINIVPAFLGVSVRTYMSATLLGIIPGALVFASIGAGLGSVFDMMMEFSLKNAVTPEIVIGLIALSILSLAPAAYRKIKILRQPV
ncbi:MAG: TVP38/TMEM64 family protein [Alphaproteobacteria bacterium]